MSIRRLPGLMPNDPSTLLTDAQRLSVGEAVRLADLRRSQALSKIEIVAASKGGSTSVDISPGSGHSYPIFRNAVLEGVRAILAAEVRAFRGAGLFGNRLVKIIDDYTIDSLVGSFELSRIERDLLRGELNLYRPEYDLPEWLLVAKGKADPDISPLCRISRDGLARLEQSRREAENEVDSFKSAASAQLSGKPEPPDSQRRLVEFGCDCVSAYVRRFGLAVFEEWEAVLKVEDPPWRLFPTLTTAVVQMGVDYTRIAHSLARVSDWKAVCQPANDYIAQLSDQVEQRTAQVGFRNGPLDSGSASRGAQGPVESLTSDSKKSGRPADSADDTIAAQPGSDRADRPFAKRSVWLEARLQERSWTKNDLARFGGPDRKTTQKILDGKAVREGVLEDVAKGLSKKLAVVKVTEIPRG